MSQTLVVSLYSAKPGCQPLSCGAGGPIAIELKSSSANKSADGAGWLVGTISATPTPVCQVGACDWVYQITIPDSEFSAEFIAGDLGEFTVSDVNSGEDAVGLCCLSCGFLMILDRLATLQERALNRESWRIHAHNVAHQAITSRLFRNHSTILIHAVEASVEEHLAGYPYADNPGKVELSFLATPAHATGPFASATSLKLEIDPASSQPLTGRLEFVPPLEIAGGKGFAISNNTEDPEAHLGLEVHVDFQVVEES